MNPLVWFAVYVCSSLLAAPLIGVVLFGRSR